MKFQKERVYSAVNADELHVGDKVIVAQHLGNLKYQVSQRDYYVWTITEIREDTYSDRFVTAKEAFPLVYLIERAENCTNCGEGRWDAEHKKMLCDPAQCANGNVVFRNQEIEVCEYWKPKTEQKAEPHFRPFKNIDELIKVWREKSKQVHSEYSLTMPYIWVRRKEVNSKGQLITEFGDELHVSMGKEGYNMTDLFVHFTFLDGSPCGVEE